MKNTFKLLLSGIIGGLTAFFIYQGILLLVNHGNIIKNNETIHEVRVGENISIPEIISKSSPSIIQIINAKKNSELINDNIYGSGVIIDSSNGYAVTNSHIINNANGLIINLFDGRSTKAKIIGEDPESDIAIIQLEDKNKLSSIKLGDSSKLKIGQTAIAIGAPLGIEFKNTITLGIISSLNKEIILSTSASKAILTVIQIDSIVNQGNTGGALLNSFGELIGINSIKIFETGSEGLSFAIPSNIVKIIADQIIKTGKFSRSQLGIFKLLELNQIMSDYYGLSKGIYVGEVLDNSSAMNSGIQKGDVIVKIEDKNISKFEQLKQVIYKKNPGDNIQIKIFRNGKTISLNAILK